MEAHTPVLLTEVLQFLDPQSGGKFIDATLGAGGHTRAILDRTAPEGRVLAFDQDELAIELARASLQSFGSRLETAKSNFRNIAAIAEERGFAGADGVLADIGVSSMMLDDAARGFSFMREGPLDMRMDREQKLTAAGVVNTYREKEIADILFNFGEERRSRPIARAIVHARPLHTTFDLAHAVQRVTGAPRYGKIHPATRTFQALRIYVNDELAALESFIDSSMGLLRPGGRLVILTFHSLEDRIVKNKFRSSSVTAGKALTRKVVTASDEELRRNPRARSAKLRAWEKA
jgi:16S rRNA (cytosine1402-N4)-methyltransferase